MCNKITETLLLKLVKTGHLYAAALNFIITAVNCG